MALSATRPGLALAVNRLDSVEMAGSKKTVPEVVENTSHIVSRQVI